MLDFGSKLIEHEPWSETEPNFLTMLVALLLAMSKDPALSTSKINWCSDDWYGSVERWLRFQTSMAAWFVPSQANHLTFFSPWLYEFLFHAFCMKGKETKSS